MFDPYSPFDPRIFHDPYPIYEQLRNEAPVHFSESYNFWLITTYHEINLILRNQKASAGPRRNRALFSNMSPEEHEKVKALYESLGLWALFNDPPIHTRRRALINKVFTPAIVEKLRPMIEAIAEELVQNVAEQSSPDLIKELAYPLPVLVIGEMLGFPKEDRSLLKEWSDDIALFIGTLKRPYELASIADKSMQDLGLYIADILRERRKKLGNDILSHLIQAEDNGQKLTDDEIIATSSMLLFAGHETTTNLIGNGILALLLDEERMAELQTCPALIPNAVEEFLRYDSPVQILGRITDEPLEVGEKRIPKDSLVLNIIASGNRDPKAFQNPDTLNFHRGENRHLAFGQGIHFCVGASLARLEGQIAFKTLLNRFPKLHQVGGPLEWNANHGFRGLKSLKVTHSVTSQK